MPWCDDCSRFYTPSTLTETGDCPEGHHVADPADEGVETPRAPWHFWVLVAGLVFYLGWRLIQGVFWLLG